MTEWLDTCEGSFPAFLLPELARDWWHYCIGHLSLRIEHSADVPCQTRARHHTMRWCNVLQVLGVARRQPEQLHHFMASGDAAQLAECVVRLLPGALQAAAARSGAARLSPGLVQDAVYAAAATVVAYGTALMDRWAPQLCLHCFEPCARLLRHEACRLQTMSIGGSASDV